MFSKSKVFLSKLQYSSALKFCKGHSSVGYISFTSSRSFHISKMANSKFEYTRNFEQDDKLLPNAWIVARIDGRGFHKFAKKHEWIRPNDDRALALMNHCANLVMKEYRPHVVVSYGQSDEYSFVFRRETNLFERRSSKIITTLVSKFTAAYVFFWSRFFLMPMKQIPSFDGRIVLYPTDQNLMDYLSWRQADCHINNLYNTTFWNLVQKGNLTNAQAEERLRGTLARDKNEILFSEFGINYNNEPEMFRKGTVLFRQEVLRMATRGNIPNELTDGEPERESSQDSKTVMIIMEQYRDIIGPSFWTDHPHLLNPDGRDVPKATQV